MKCLAINTAGTTLSIAIVENDNCLYLFEEAERKGQGNKLIGYIEKALSESNTAFTDIDLMAVATGPGSFTGIRVGIAAIRGFALASKINISGVSSFDIYASPSKDKLNIIAMESWREELYFAFKGVDGTDVLEAVNISPSKIKEYLVQNNLDANNMLISGDAAYKLKDIFPDAECADASLVTAADLAKIAIARYKNNILEKPTPYYLRNADISESTKIVHRTICK